jgi:Domain of unknown function (DUF4129)
VVALVLLAWSVASLARSVPGGGLLVNSYWLLYIVDLLPLVGLGVMVLLIVLLVFFFKDLSAGLGSGIARKRKQRKKYSALRFLVVVFSWAFAVMFLMLRCNGIICNQSNGSIAKGLEQNVLGGSDPSPALISFQATVAGLTSFVRLSWFMPAFLGLIVVCSLVVARSVFIGLRESKREVMQQIMANQERGLEAVQEAINMISDIEVSDPRARIINCYRCLVTAATDLGAPLTPDETARELERKLSRIFLLNGPAMKELTGLFEEARYSLHTITENDSLSAKQFLLEIEDDMTHRRPS